MALPSLVLSFHCPDGGGALRQRFGFLFPARFPIKLGHILKDHGRIGMIRVERLLQDRLYQR